MESIEKMITERMVELGYKADTFYVVVNDPRHPQVVFWDNYQGFWWDYENHKLGEKFCTCNAFEASECCCGVWDDSEDYGDGEC